MMTPEEYKERVAGTNIDPRSLLCTDYFNHFNEVVMMFSMVGDMPELLDDIDKWDFKTYREHFMESGLGFAPLAIECYEATTPELRERFEKIATQMSMLIVETRAKLRGILENGEMDKFKDIANLHSMELQGMIDDGAAIVHGYTASMDQSKIDAMFP
ncbi:MAG: hypothetical protein EOM37_04945 [Proteobacteria bacterium]|jgi:hypothetical protein|nr:hypothetical protein [Alphaproteobacteria bacterium]NCC03380.1 hypothetical protein [Pseudomonadota bacterium]